MADDAQDKALEGLLVHMPRIAEAVSAFPESVQQKAFDALMAAATGVSAPAAQQTDDDAGGRSAQKSKKRRRAAPKTAEEKSGEGRAKPRRRSAPSVLRDLDLAPKGKKSFRDFAAEKNPTNQYDKNAVAVYYLAEIIKVGQITVDHVYTCYRTVEWPVPADLANSLQQTASRKLFIDSADADDLKLMNKGLNHVEHTLPVKKAEPATA